MESRLRFLLQLVLDYNAEHNDTKAVFRVDSVELLIYVEDNDGDSKMVESVGFRDLNEEKAYMIYRKLKETDTTEQ